MRFFFENEGHTFVAMVREELERMAAQGDEFVCCEQLHYLDTHVVVEAPDAAYVRTCLLNLKARVAKTRAEINSR